MKKNMSNFVLILLFIVGLSLLLYPSLSDYWNTFHSSKAIAGYSEAVANLNTEEYDRMLGEAVSYNEQLKKRENAYTVSEELAQRYPEILNLDGKGAMGYIEIPQIGVSLPIYHGTKENVLQSAVGHLDWTSFPVGGEGTHCALSGHRGLPSAKLFTDLDKLGEGDIFVLQILHETLTYEVDQIMIVEPHDSSALAAEPGKDYCTLITCTPYGINSHRLLVRGHRIDNLKTSRTVRVVSEAIQVEPLVIALLMGVPLLILALLLLMLSDGYANQKIERMKRIEKMIKENKSPQERR